MRMMARARRYLFRNIPLISPQPKAEINRQTQKLLKDRLFPKPISGQSIPLN
jgi:hypothetical protein